MDDLHKQILQRALVKSQKSTALQRNLLEQQTMYQQGKPEKQQPLQTNALEPVESSYTHISGGIAPENQKYIKQAVQKRKSWFAKVMEDAAKQQQAAMSTASAAAPTATVSPIFGLVRVIADDLSASTTGPNTLQAAQTLETEIINDEMLTLQQMTDLLSIFNEMIDEIRPQLDIYEPESKAHLYLEAVFVVLGRCGLALMEKYELINTDSKGKRAFSKSKRESFGPFRGVSRQNLAQQRRNSFLQSLGVPDDETSSESDDQQDGGARTARSSVRSRSQSSATSFATPETDMWSLPSARSRFTNTPMSSMQSKSSMRSKTLMKSKRAASAHDPTGSIETTSATSAATPTNRLSRSMVARSAKTPNTLLMQSLMNTTADATQTQQGLMTNVMDALQNVLAPLFAQSSTTSTALAAPITATIKAKPLKRRGSTSLSSATAAPAIASTIGTPYIMSARKTTPTDAAATTSSPVSPEVIFNYERVEARRQAKRKLNTSQL